MLLEVSLGPAWSLSLAILCRLYSSTLQPDLPWSADNCLEAMLHIAGHEAVSFCAATPALCHDLQAAPGKSSNPASDGRRSLKRKRPIIEAQNAVHEQEASDYQPGGEARSDDDAEMETL